MTTPSTSTWDRCAPTQDAFAPRCFDLMLAPLLGVIALPIVAVSALAIWLEGGGPVLYRQRASA